MAKPDYDAEFEDWLVIVTRRCIVLTGRVYSDRKGRFADGIWIRTSMVLTSLDAIESGQVITTLNSRYLLCPVRASAEPGRYSGRTLQ
ncbi:hypothetical protein HJG53_16975 [Sphingomonas sp. ID1715]|uniref:hypothetical protein n=1 Tax=Sphingomonas sp. ID1715 TaxID=1656898 RepID=UPI001489C337|nr:hypothetical protein [Sphingomonas sp. ID1715]NNM78583.1 hypothetical protein [Sphingomonas sp. ID1715]